MPCTEPGNNRSSYLFGSAVNAFGNLSTSRLPYSLLFQFQFQFLFHFWVHIALLTVAVAAVEVMHLKSRPRRVVFMVIAPRNPARSLQPSRKGSSRLIGCHISLDAK